MEIKSGKDFRSGAMFVAIGLAFAWLATSYPMGTAARMGPGWFPFWLGILLALLGALITIASMLPNAERNRMMPFDWRTIILVLGSVVLFGLLMKPLGLYLALVVLVVVSSAASYQFGWKATLANALFLVIFAHLAFIKGLGLIFPLYPSLID